MLKRMLWVSIFSVIVTAQASAGLIGSWEVDQGPSWQPSPTAYTGQEAAALLFGGNPSDYWISTDPNTITHTAWYSIIYVGLGEFAENYTQNTSGLYQTSGDASAYVNDNAIGPTYTNYAFSATPGVPEPGTTALVLSGLAASVAVIRRRKLQR